MQEMQEESDSDWSSVADELSIASDSDEGADIMLQPDVVPDRRRPQ